ncbi:MAG: hypothetical protein Q8L57_02885 [bacterium]|nr:hypothetical protein [bacterium]
MKRFPKSIRKYIRKEKARVRREVFDAAEQKKQIADLIAKLKMQYNKDKSQTPDSPPANPANDLPKNPKLKREKH